MASRSPSPERPRHTHWWLKLHLLPSHTAPPPSKDAAKPKQRMVLDFTQNVPQGLPHPPFVEVAGVPNFRDLGQFRAGTGRRTRPGFAYRCSEPSQITSAASHRLVEVLAVRTLFDLRSEREFSDPRGHPLGVRCVSVPVFRRHDLTRQLSVQQLAWATAADHPGEAFSRGFVAWYRQIAEYGARSAYRAVFEHIRDKPAEPFVFHCSAGKDRTGVLAALILKACGVADDEVAWEYALTVPGMGAWEAAVEQESVGDSMLPIRAHGGMTREEAHRICGSRAVNMARWLDQVLDKEFGGAHAYLRDHAGFSQEEVDTIVRNLVEDGDGSVRIVDVPGMDDHPQT